jgi:hypothetical protein
VEGAWRYDAAAKKVQLDLTQTEPGEPYRLPLEVGITAPGTAAAKVEKVRFDQKQQHFEFAAEQEPAEVELDPNVWLLIDAKIVKK